MCKVTLCLYAYICLYAPNALITQEDTARNCSLLQPKHSPDPHPAPFSHHSYGSLTPQWSLLLYISSPPCYLFLGPYSTFPHYTLLCQAYLNGICLNPETSVFTLVISSTPLKQRQQNPATNLPAHRVAIPSQLLFVVLSLFDSSPACITLSLLLHNTADNVLGDFCLGGGLLCLLVGFLFAIFSFSVTIKLHLHEGL